MSKKIIYIILTFSLILQVGCSSQDYKRIVLREDIGFEEEIRIEQSVAGQIDLEISGRDYFSPSFYHGGGIYGHLLKIHDNDPMERKYLYKIDANYRLSETSKENINSIKGTNVIGFIGDKVYDMDYKIRNSPKEIPSLSAILNDFKEEDRKFQLSYVSGSDNYIAIHQLDSKDEIREIYLYDKSMKKIYTSDRPGRIGEISYLKSFRTMIWIDQKDFQIYKIILGDKSYGLEREGSSGAGDNIDRIRAVSKGNHNIILFYDSKLSDKEDWKLMETVQVIELDYLNRKYTPILVKKEEEYLYAEYLGNNLFITEGFDLFENYIETSGRSIYHQYYGALNRVHKEEFQERSQEYYPDIRIVANVKGNEIFSTRIIKKIINGVPTIKDVVYQEFKLSVPTRNQY